MTQDLVDQLFRDRYAPAIRFSRRAQRITIGIGLLLLVFCLMRVRIWWSIPLAFGFYFALHKIFFKKWNPKAVRDRILLATRPATATIYQADSIFGLYQIAYRFEWQGRTYESNDIVSPTEFEHHSIGETVEIQFDPSRPKNSYVIPLDRAERFPPDASSSHARPRIQSCPQTRKDLPHLQTPLHLAQKMGGLLGTGEVLLRTL